MYQFTKHHNMKISLFPHAREVNPSDVLAFEQYLLDIKEGKWQDIVLPIRVAKIKYLKGEITKDSYQALKAKVPAVTASGVFAVRNKSNFKEHSGIIAIDFDSDDNPDGIPLDQLAADEYTYSAHRSIGGGEGLVVYVKIDPAKHLEAFLGLEKYYADNYQVIADKSCKDVGRLRYISYDPDLFQNLKAKTFKAYLPKKVQSERTKKSTFICGRNDVELVIEQLQAQNISLGECYDDWIRLGMAFANEFGAGGRSYFHDVSQMSNKYDAQKCDKKYDHLLRSKTTVNIGSFFFMAKQAGIEKIKTDETVIIETIAKKNKLKIGKAGFFKDQDQATETTKRELKDRGVMADADVIDAVIEKVNTTPNQELKESQLTGDVFNDTIAFVKSLGLRFNEITRSIELNTQDINDKDYNSFYIQAKKMLGKGVIKSDLVSIIESDEIDSYNPFIEFLESLPKNENVGYIQELLNCLELDNSENEDYTHLINDFITKWLVSIIASMNGTYSIMCLVLCGAQGRGKTEFFRGLLPKAMKKYYAESKLDEGKDDYVLMTKKLIILDDEFGGKSKQDAKKFKDLISKQTFTLRRPYGRISEDLPRYAVLCGTSNEDEVINDPTGNRRIIPVNIKGFNLDRFKAINKVALWSEIYDLYNLAGDEWMLSRENIEDLTRITALNKQASQEEEAFLQFFRIPETGQFTEFKTNTEIKSTIEMNTRLKISHVKLAAVLKSLGVQKSVKKINGVTQTVYSVLNLQP